MSSKLDVINQAYSQMRINGLTVNPTPELITLALSRLEAMMSGFEIYNICVGYNFEAVPDLNSPTGVERGFDLMMETNLATNLIPDFGKQVPPKLEQMASTWLSNAAGASAVNGISEVSYPNRMPRGSGESLRYNRWQRFYREPNEPLDFCTVKKMFVGEINDYTESFNAYLGDEVISTIVITSTQGINIVSSSNTDDIVSYRVEAIDTSTTGTSQQVTMNVTTDTGRKETRAIEFDIETLP